MTTDEFIQLSERISGQDLDALFETWLFTPGRPALPGAPRLQGSATTQDLAPARSVRSLMKRLSLKR